MVSPLDAEIVSAEPVGSFDMGSLDMEIAIWEKMRSEKELEEQVQAKFALTLMY